MKKGIYRHYKNPDHKYRLIGVAKHSETLEDLVVCEALYKNELSQLWVRPLAMWEEEVFFDGQKVKRFQFEKEG